MTNTSYMKNLYSRLGLFGFNQKFLRDCILPEWWEDSHAESASNRLIVEALICRHLGIDLASLQDVCSELKLQSAQQVKFKLPVNSNPEAVKVAHVLGGRQ